MAAGDLNSTYHSLEVWRTAVYTQHARVHSSKPNIIGALLCTAVVWETLKARQTTANTPCNTLASLRTQVISKRNRKYDAKIVRIKAPADRHSKIKEGLAGPTKQQCPLKRERSAIGERTFECLCCRWLPLTDQKRRQRRCDVVHCCSKNAEHTASLNRLPETACPAVLNDLLGGGKPTNPPPSLATGVYNGKQPPHAFGHIQRSLRSVSYQQQSSRAMEGASWGLKITS